MNKHGKEGARPRVGGTRRQYDSTGAVLPYGLYRFYADSLDGFKLHQHKWGNYFDSAWQKYSQRKWLSQQEQGLE